MSNKIKIQILIIFSILLILIGSEGTVRIYAHFSGFSYRDAVKQLKSKRYTANIHKSNDNGYSQLLENVSEVSTTSEYSVIYETNELGLRDDPVSNDEDYFLGLGDSLTFGEGVNKSGTYIDLIEKGIGINILNLASPGHSIGQVWNSLRHNAPLIQNKKACILFYVKPLFWRNWLGRNQVNQSEKKVSTIRIDNNSEIVKDFSLEKYSEAFALIRYFLILREATSKLEQVDKEKWKITAKEHHSRYYHKQDTTDSEKVEHNKFYINKIKNYCLKETGKKLIIINLDYGNEYPFLNEMEGIKYISLHNALSEYSKVNEISFKYDRHYNPEMHKFISELAIKELKKYLSK